MNKKVKRCIRFICFLFLILFCFFLYRSNFLFNHINLNSTSIPNILEKNINLVIFENDKFKLGTNENEIINLNHNIADLNIKNYNWGIYIPQINLNAEISDGTTKDVMNYYIGHFIETSKTDGNIGLAAHNRGYNVNYFSDLKNLHEGDEIFYKYYDFEKIYIVVKNKIIKDTDWSTLESTDNNKITLITCVENEPEYRRCVQAVEKI